MVVEGSDIFVIMDYYLCFEDLILICKMLFEGVGLVEY